MQEPTELQAAMEAMKARLAGLSRTLAQFREAVREVQDVIAFQGHPELIALDDELDTMYRGQL